MKKTGAVSAIVESSNLDLAISAWLHKHGKRDDEYQHSFTRLLRDLQTQ